MSDVKLGKLITGSASRDAIHVAVAPVVAGQDLWPGERVGFMPDGRVGTIPHRDKHIGIVDPFLIDEVKENDRFYLVLFQGTVTGMRHEWQHPAFDPGVVAAPDRAGAEAWLRAYAIDVNPYDEDPNEAFKTLIRNAEDGCIFYHGRDCHSLSDVENADELFKNLSTYWGRTVTASNFGYSCSC